MSEDPEIPCAQTDVIYIPLLNSTVTLSQPPHAELHELQVLREMRLYDRCHCVVTVALLCEKHLPWPSATRPIHRGGLVHFPVQVRLDELVGQRGEHHQRQVRQRCLRQPVSARPGVREVDPRPGLRARPATAS